MWCSRCQQDVPGRASKDSGGELCCPRCGQPLIGHCCGPTGDKTSEPGERVSGKADGDLAGYDGWELGQQLHDVQRALQTADGGNRGRQAVYRQEAARLDPPHAGSSPWHPAAAGKSAHLNQPHDAKSPGVLGVLTWAALSLGTMAFACGGILLGWSIVTDRTELWTVGMPIALGGQIALLVGLILQFERLWHDSRRASAKLDTVDKQLHELKTTTTLLGTTHSSPAGAFYSHLADGATPQLLLSDLKGQLDLLALKMAQEEQ